MNRLFEACAALVPITQEEFVPILARWKPVSLSKGADFLRQGQLCRSIAFVTKGVLRTFTLDPDGQEVTSHFAHEGSFALSFYSFKRQVASLENIQALSDTELLTLSWEDLQWVSKTVPLWRDIYQTLIEEAYACMEERTYMLQNLTAADKYELFIANGHPSIVQHATLGQIASYLGITQETLSRIRKKVKAQ